jgi:hypothetical protein
MTTRNASAKEALRIATRAQGEWVVAYLAQMHTMDAAIEIARLRMSAADNDPQAFEAWLAFLQGHLDRLILNITGEKVVGYTRHPGQEDATTRQEAPGAAFDASPWWMSPPAPPAPPSPAPEPAPEPEFRAGGRGDFAGAGASGSWDAPTPSPAPADPPSSSDSGGSSSSSSDSGSSSGGGD